MELITLFVLLLIIFIFPFLFILCLIPYLIYQINLIKKYEENYKNKLYSKQVSLTLRGEPFYVIKQGFLFNSFSKRKFDDLFDQTYCYDLVIKTKNKKFIKLLEIHRKLSRIYCFIFNIYFVGIIVITLVIFLLINIFGEINLTW